VSGLLVGCGFKSDLSIPDENGMFVNDSLPKVQSGGVEVSDDIFIQPGEPGGEEVEIEVVPMTEDEQVSPASVEEIDEDDDDNDGVPVDLTKLLGNKK